MCGRFTLSTPADVIAEVMQLAELITWEPRYNIAPTQPALAVRANDVGQRRGGLLHWGLIPSWAKDPAIGNRLINARGETLAAKPSFRSAFRRQRCLIVADGFYEWQKSAGGKQPYCIRRRDQQPFAFAGLWERWSAAAASPAGAIESCTIVTTTPNAVLAPIHDRMPVVLAADDYDTWLDPALQDAERLQPLLQPCPPDDWEAYPVSQAVNRPAYDEPACVERAGGELFS